MLHDPDTSDLVPPPDSGVQTEPEAHSLEDIQDFLLKRDAWRQSRVATHEERCPF